MARIQPALVPLYEELKPKAEEFLELKGKEAADLFADWVRPGATNNG
jgi:hypothetical protein